MARLRSRIKEVAAKNGLAEAFTLFAPGDSDDANCQVHIFLIVDDDYLEGADPEVDAEFQRVMDEAAKAEADAKAQEARERLSSLRDNLDKGDGIL
jgi:hypothetical protein